MMAFSEIIALFLCTDFQDMSSLIVTIEPDHLILNLVITQTCHKLLNLGLELWNPTMKTYCKLSELFVNIIIECFVFIKILIIFLLSSLRWSLFLRWLKMTKAWLVWKTTKFSPENNQYSLMTLKLTKDWVFYEFESTDTRDILAILMFSISFKSPNTVLLFDKPYHRKMKWPR